jgi:hypothetical protein
VVNARGYGAHGYFETYKSLAEHTRADIFQPRRRSTGAPSQFHQARIFSRLPALEKNRMCDTADHGWHIGQMGSGGHRGHGHRKIAGQFRVYVLLEHIHHRLL